MDRPMTARELWRLLEPLHAVVYFSPDEVRRRFGALGLKGFWMSYFASRAAALGPVGSEVVEALFYVFHRGMVTRALPEAWQLADPQAVLEVRATMARDLLGRSLGDQVDGDDIATAATLALRSAQGIPRAGRPLGAAHAAVPPPPTDRVGQLWWAATVLREHRFDGHVAALVSSDVGPCEALALAAARGAAGPDGARLLQASRKWPDDEWAEATERLTARGWLTEDGGLTDEGRAAHQGVEDLTDRLAAPAFAPLAEDDRDALLRALRSLVARVAASGAVLYPNPIGLGPPTEAGRR